MLRNLNNILLLFPVGITPNKDLILDNLSVCFPRATFHGLVSDKQALEMQDRIKIIQYFNKEEYDKLVDLTDVGDVLENTSYQSFDNDLRFIEGLHKVEFEEGISINKSVNKLRKKEQNVISILMRKMDGLLIFRNNKDYSFKTSRGCYAVRVEMPNGISYLSSENGEIPLLRLMTDNKAKEILRYGICNNSETARRYV